MTGSLFLKKPLAPYLSQMPNKCLLERKPVGAMNLLSLTLWYIRFKITVASSFKPDFRQ
jgi:hypothetical protein